MGASMSVECEAQRVALYEPLSAVLGWLAGARAEGDVCWVAVLERALVIREGWST